VLKNYIKIAFRNLFRKKLYSFLNITGLSIGFACSFLILFYIQDELSYDRFHDKADRIYRVEADLSTTERSLKAATSANPLGPMLQADFPEVEAHVRFSSYGQQKILQYGETMFYEEKFLWVDANLFEVFTFPLLKGDPSQALIRPNTVVITEEMALKYFGDEDPMGKSLRVNNDSLYEVTGVLKHIPKTSHIRPDFLASIATLNLKPSGNAIRDLLMEINYYTFLLLNEGADVPGLEQKFVGFIDKTIGPAMKAVKGSVELKLRPLANIYLHSDRENEQEHTSSLTFVYLFAGIGLFILLLACLNFMNLSTARSANRAREVGLRKVVGAQKRQLIQQFLGESTVITFIAAAISLLLVYLSMPLFRILSGKDITAGFLVDPVFLLGLLVLVLVISLIGGSYPAFFLSAFRPIETLQGKLKRGPKSSLMRIVLVSFQFTVSIVLIIGTLTVGKQLTHIRNKDLGYVKEHIVSIRVRNPETQKKLETLKSVFLQHPDVLQTAASATTPLGFNDFRGDHPVGRPENELFMMFVQFVDKDYVDLYGMNIIEGRNFSRDFPNDPQGSIIINETMARKLDWQDDPLSHEVEVGHEIMRKKMRFRVVGVVQDYHFQTLHDEVAPMVLFNSCLYGSFDRISVKLRPENVQTTMGFLETKWSELDPQYPFEFSFVDDLFDELYRAEERMGSLFGYFTALAIVIGCLGLFGLTSFTAEQRTKEIGIRKVLGASVSGIIFLLIKQFTKWVLLAVLIAWPIGYFVMNNWLQNFAYRIGVGVDTLVIAAVLAFVVSLITVSFQSIRAALAEPINSLRYE
jgi:putative ABC transport system permease protein